MNKSLTKEARRNSRQMLRTEAAARYCGLSESTLHKLRCTGSGPEYLKLGGKIVVYDQDDLDAWLDTHRRKSTSVAA